MSELFVEARDVQKQYQLANGSTKMAVDGVSFRLQEGERLGLVGRNGAGKTTLLQLLAGISSPTGGTLDINGRVTAIFTLGMGLREDLSGLENIYVEGELQGLSRSKVASMVDGIVDFAELGEFIHAPIRTYSTGMKGRLAFSTIVHVEPEILIIDETLSVGDAKFSAKANVKMRELTQKGRILILVSHSMAAVQDMCTRCIWMDDGRIRQDGTPTEVTQAYLQEVRHADEASFIARFRSALVDESLQEGWRVAELGLRNAEGVPVTNVVTGEPVLLAARVDGKQGARFDSRLRIERMDGLVVLDTLSSAAEGARHHIGAEGRSDIAVDFGPLRLNYGAYKAEWQVLSGRRTTARRTMLFEVINPRPPLGGRPVLVYPSTTRVRPLS